MTLRTKLGTCTAAFVVAIMSACSAAHSDATPASGLQIDPASAEVAPGGSVAFVALLEGSAVTNVAAVSWTIEEGAAGGSIDAAGRYTAPQSPGTFHVRATSVVDATRSAGSTLIVLPEAAATAQFHVATTGDDANPGTAAQPWRTIQKAMTAATAGSTVNVHGGTYRERLNLRVSGTDGKFITFQPSGFSGAPGCGGYTGIACGGDQVIVDYGSMGTFTDGVPFLRINGNSFVRIQGITFQNYTVLGGMQRGVEIHGSANHVEILHNRFLNNRNVGAWDGSNALLHFWVEPPARVVTIRGNEFGGIWSSYGEALTTTTDSVVIEGNWMHDTDAIGMNIGQGSSNVVVRNNLLEWISRRRDGSVFYGNRANAVYVNGGATTVIEDNVVRDSEWAYTVCSEPGYPNSHDVVIRNNVAYRTYAGVMVGNWYDMDPGPVYAVRVLNNTLHAVENAMVIRPYTSASVVWQNNLLSSVSNPVVNATSWPTGTMAYNVITANALFTDPGAGNFTLQAGSPAIDAGDPGAAVADVSNVDAAGLARIAGGRIDAGAFERQ